MLSCAGATGGLQPCITRRVVGVALNVLAQGIEAVQNMAGGSERRLVLRNLADVLANGFLKDGSKGLVISVVSVIGLKIFEDADREW